MTPVLRGSEDGRLAGGGRELGGTFEVDGQVFTWGAFQSLPQCGGRSSR
jgi:hypothetical protein